MPPPRPRPSARAGHSPAGARLHKAGRPPPRLLLGHEVDLSRLLEFADRGDDGGHRGLAIGGGDLGAHPADLVPDRLGHPLGDVGEDEFGRRAGVLRGAGGDRGDEHLLVDFPQDLRHVARAHAGGNVEIGEDRLADRFGEAGVGLAQPVEHVVARGRAREVEDRAHPFHRPAREGAGHFSRPSSAASAAPIRSDRVGA
jgi:hypothetical protein